MVDRLTHWYSTSREWIKKAVLMDGLYVFNNPWAIQSMEKHTSYCAMMRLGMPDPRDVDGAAQDLRAPARPRDDARSATPSCSTSARSATRVGYPLFMKPYDGGGWAGVRRIDDEAALRKAYDESGTLSVAPATAVEPHDLFVRCIGLGPQTRLVRYDPSAPLHDRYTMDDGGRPRRPAVRSWSTRR